MSDLLENKIAKSGLENIDLATFSPVKKIKVLDIKQWLWQELIIKEDDFKAHLDAHDWNQYKNDIVAYTCSVEAIIPNWAYMLIVKKLNEVNAIGFLGNYKEALTYHFLNNIDEVDVSLYTDKRVLINGCSDVEVPSAAYVHLTQKLLPVVKSLMFGEACSNVPIYKAPKTK